VIEALIAVLILVIGATLILKRVVSRRRHDTDLFTMQMEAAMIYERHRRQDRRLERPVEQGSLDPSWVAQKN